MAAMTPHLQQQKKGSAKDFVAMFRRLKKQTPGVEIVKEPESGA